MDGIIRFLYKLLRIGLSYLLNLAVQAVEFVGSAIMFLRFWKLLLTLCCRHRCVPASAGPTLFKRFASTARPGGREDTGTVTSSRQPVAASSFRSFDIEVFACGSSRTNCKRKSIQPKEEKQRSVILRDKYVDLTPWLECASHTNLQDQSRQPCTD